MTPTSKRATALTSPRRQRGPSLTRLLPGESAEDYWDGNPQGSRPRYVTNLLSDPANAFFISVPIPADSELYGRFAGSAIDAAGHRPGPVLAYCRKSSAGNRNAFEVR